MEMRRRQTASVDAAGPPLCPSSVNGQKSKRKSDGRQRQAAARSKKKREASKQIEARKRGKGRSLQEPAAPTPPPRRGIRPVVRDCCRRARRASEGGGGMMEAGGGGAGGGAGRDERVPQWGAQETRELIAARGEVEREADAARRSAKTMWEAVAARLRQRGYRRTADQCKCKWKNLVNRYKGKETSDPENGRQCPFFEELHAVFTERARNMQRQLLESESGASVKRKLKRPSGDRSSGESDDEDNGGEESEDEKPLHSRKRKADDKKQQSQRTAEKSRTGVSRIHELLQDFLAQQQRIDIQWQETMERRAQERVVFEQEWRLSMQKLEQERLMLEHSWMQREEQRRMREEARAEKRDALLNTLLNKLLQEDL